MSYSCDIRYPVSLHHLNLLRSAAFRKALVHAEVIERLTAEIQQTHHASSVDKTTVKLEVTAQ